MVAMTLSRINELANEVLDIEANSILRLKSNIGENFEKAIDILLSMVRFPDLPEDVCRSEKEVIDKECCLALDKPGTVTIQKLISEVYRVHPVRIPIIGLREKIAKGEKLEKWEKQMLRENRDIIMIKNKDDEEFERELWGD